MRRYSTDRSPRAGALAGVTVLAGLALSGPAAAQSGIFQGLSGSWSGRGSITLIGGESEPIRCRASYEVDDSGNKLQQTLRCASDSYRFDVESSVSYSKAADVITGNWSETNYGVNGTVRGSVRGPRILATVKGRTFEAKFLVETSGDSQTVTIAPSTGTDVKEVAVKMSRGGS